MAELKEGVTTELATTEAAQTYTLNVVEFDAAGKGNSFSISTPKTPEWQERLLRVAMLKKTTWPKYDTPTILHADIYAERMGLDIVAGDVYMAAEGRISTTAGAKIRHAMGTGKIVGYQVEFADGPEVTIPYRVKEREEKWTGRNLKIKITVRVRDWTEPMIYETTLAEWFVGGNPNWRTRPAYMLRRNALSKALEEVAPMGVEADEAPPVEVGEVKTMTGGK